MTHHHRGWLLLGIGTLAACQLDDHYVEASRALTRGITFVESGRGGTKTDHSSVDAQRLATRVPSPASIDIDSRLDIGVAASVLRRGHLPPADELRLAELVERQHQIALQVAAIGNFLELRAAAIDAYTAWIDAGAPDAASRQFQRLEQAKLEMAAVERDEILRGAWRNLWPAPANPSAAQEQQAIHEAADEAFSSLSSGSTDAQQRLQEELLTIERATAAILGDDLFQLRIEAVLRSPGREAMPLHLDGYDSLPEGKLERRDRWGLALEGAARDRFDTLTRQSFELAAAGERVRKGEQRVEEAFRSMANTAIGDPAVAVADGARLVESLEGGRLQRRLRNTMDSARRLTEALSQELPEAAMARLTLVREVAEGGAQRLVAGLGDASGLRSVQSDLATLKDYVEHPQATKLSAVVPLVAGLPKKARDALDNGIRATVQESTRILAEVDATIAGTDAAMRTLVADRWRESDLHAEVLEWQRLATEVDGFLQRVLALRGLAGLTPLAVDLRVPEAIDVPLDDAPGTFLDLQRTPRLIGDQVSVRVTLLDGGEPVGAPSEASFIVRQFGWHARLDPAVVLVRPDRLAAGNETFRFAPVVSWLHEYDPRPGESGIDSDFLSATDLAVGPHATFLSFDDDSEIEIGLGVTVGLWNGVLQGGVGYNLQADASGNGGIYYFVGSSLIPLLQQFQGQ